MNYQRAVNMCFDGVEEEQNKFFNSPDFDKHRYDSMLNQLKEFINTADFSEKVYFDFPQIFVNGWLESYRVHPWWKNDEHGKSFPQTNVYVENVIIEVSKYNFEIYKEDRFSNNRLRIKPKIVNMCDYI